ncbi:MAG: hypothetical protein FWC00_02545, partial [Firmicutes bacterium]|nr:hypothetical protein [Bacillota bacterium]
MKLNFSFSKRTKIIVAASVALLVIIAASIAIPLSITRQEFTLAAAPRTIVFHSAETNITLPRVIGSATATTRWELLSENNASVHIVDNIRGNVAEIINNNQYRIFNFEQGVTQNSVVFRANVFENQRQVATLDYALTIINPTSDTFTVLYSTNQSGRLAYRVQGIARERVFGLWDIVTETGAGGIIDQQAAANQFLSNQTRGYVHSGDVIYLGWRYVGNVDLSVEVLDDNGQVLSARMCDEHQRRVIVDFLGAGVRTVRVTGTTAGGQTAVYEYRYDIRDAVNAFDIYDIKELEFNARVQSIINGVEHDRTLAANDRRFPQFTYNYQAFNHFVPRPTQRLNSDRFHVTTISVPRTESIAAAARATQFLTEIRLWKPSFSYRDLVIRDNMLTLDEATLFFGSVFGNGFRIDATPYAENTHDHIFRGLRQVPLNGAYRNVWGSGHCGNGFENLPFREGHGWGDLYAFYALANNSTIDNIVLTAWNNTNPDGTPVRLSEYRRIGVISTANFDGPVQFFDGNRNPIPIPRPALLDFQVGSSRVQTNGVFQPGMGIEGITLSNSIFEMGLILVGSSFSANPDNPLTIASSVLRYSAFTALWGRGISRFGSDNRTARYTHVPDYTNFVTLIDVIIYEISTVAVVLEDSESGTQVTLQGERNRFFTWLRMTDLVFPIFKLPGLPISDEAYVLAISDLAQQLIAAVLADNQDAIVQEAPTFWVNIPLLSVGGPFTRNSWVLGGNMNTPSREFSVSVPLGPGLILDFMGQLPTDDPRATSVHFQNDTFDTPGALSRLIAGIV